MTPGPLLNQTIGITVTCAKTVAESDVMLFAGITGDFSPNHVDEAAMANTAYGGRIAHGALLVGYMSRASTLIADACPDLMRSHYPVSLGYDRVRFLRGVRIGDTLTIGYRIAEVDVSKARTIAMVEMKNQRDELCAAATHIMTWLARTPTN
jgi:3-hydroxybutyryl-CoA dehydratase